MSEPVCNRCRDGNAFTPDFSFAFQPIVDAETRTVFAYEALVRGLDGGGAFSVLSQVTDETRYSFDQKARAKAIELASKLMPSGREKLSINFMPNAVYDPALCLRATLKAANTFGFPLDRLMFEMMETEEVLDLDHVKRIFDHYASCNFLVAIDDFGAGFSGLTMFAEVSAHVIKIDRKLITDVDISPRQQAIIAGILATAETLGTVVVGEGIETHDEFSMLRSLGLRYFQGYLLARPEFEALPEITIPEEVSVPRGADTPDQPPLAA